MNITTVFFDLDGVLAASWEHIIACYSHALDQLGLPKDALLDPKIRHCTYYQAFAHLGIPKSDFKKADEICVAFADENIHLIKPFPSSLSTLQSLRKKKIRIGVVSNRQGNSSTILRHCGLFDHIELIIGAEDVPVAKPHPHGISLALEYFDSEPEETIMVGDTCSDIYAGNAAGLITVAVDTSDCLEALKKARPHYIISNLEELIPLIAQL